MCLVIEHAKLIKERDSLLQRVSEIEKQLKQPPLPDITILSIQGAEVFQEIMSLGGLKLMYPILMDQSQRYYYTNSEGWAEVFNYIYMVFNMPPYLAARMDCEDFAFLLKGLVSALFGLNWFAFTIGESPRGCHGYNFFKTDNGLLMFEPQTGEFFGWRTGGYLPEYVLL